VRGPRSLRNVRHALLPVILAATAAVAVALSAAARAVASATVRLGAFAVARLGVGRLGVTRRALARGTVTRRVLCLQLLRLLWLLRAVTTGRRRVRRGRGRTCAHGVAVRHVRGDRRCRDVDRVLTAVTGLVTDVHLFLTVGGVAVGRVAGRRGLVRSRRRHRAGGRVSSIREVILFGLGLRLLVVRGLPFAVTGRRGLCGGRLGLGRARGRLVLCRAGRDLREADACSGGEREARERADEGTASQASQSFAHLESLRGVESWGLRLVSRHRRPKLAARSLVRGTPAARLLRESCGRRESSTG